MGAQGAAIVGRAHELERLREAVLDTSRGRGGVWLLCGEAGIGKSRLAEEASALAAERGVVVVWGRAWEVGGAPVLWPWVQVLRALLATEAGRAAREALGARARLLARGLPELRERDSEIGDAIDPERARFELIDAMGSLVIGVASRAPTMIVLDDLHGADPSSLLLAEYVARHLRSVPLVLVGTYREHEAERTAHASSFARLARDARVLALRRLGEAEVGALLLEGEGTPDPTIVRAVHEASEGNPLFVVELARYWRAQASTSSLVRATTIAIPHGIREVLRERLGALPAPDVAMLEAASVLGRDVRVASLAELLETSVASLGAALRRCAGARVLVELAPGALRFSHVLLREVLYQQVDSERRAVLHARAATCLEQRRDAGAEVGTSEIAFHWAAAAAAGGGARERASAVMSARRAAEEADAQLAFEDVVAWYERALEWTDTGVPASTRVELLLALGSARIRAGDVARGQEACLAAAALARAQGAELFARAALAYGAAFVYATIDVRLIALLDEALAALPADARALRARVMARLAAAQQPAADPWGPIALAREAIALARETGDRRVLLETLRSACSAMMDFAEPSERAALNAEHVALAEALGEPVDAMRGSMRLVIDCYEAGDTVAGRAAIERCERVAERLGHSFYAWPVAAMRAMDATLAGRWDEADRWLDEAKARSERARDPNASRALAVARVARLRTERRDVDALAMLPALEQALTAMPFGRAATHALASAMLARAGRLDEAGARLATADVDEMIALGDVALLSCIGEVALALHDAALATRVAERLRPLEGRFRSWGLFGMTCEGPVAALLGSLAALRGEVDDARGWLERALERAQRAGATPYVDAIRVELVALGAPRSVPARMRRAITMRRDGETWVVEREGAPIRLKDSKGLQWLARLIAEPGRDVHVLELAAPDARDVDRGDAGELLDERAKQAYRARLAALEEERAEAEAWNDVERAARAREEIDALRAEIARGLGLGGRARRAGSAVEKARINVQRRLRDAIERIAVHDAALGRLLERSIRTGTSCRYDPE
ncbi:ATP-binding protein [Sandaracinus amylolyticus]|uniref:Regulatory protein, LuxR n=1 Tax=Sandaracinus amylolyticus TaxID=927083 RepID=A0A0F6YJW3_9BACT|nr:AAA family ATPase [Sandaracinus amylolyticus]AKF08241.1 regulatory protein, LuxR [Sandaracinus amylolyticus]